MKTLLPALSLLAGALLFSGCATVMHGGGQQTLGISSSPSDAKVVIDDKTEGTTPYTISLDRDKAHKIVVTKEGYEEASATAVPQVSAWIAGNLLIGGLIGLAVDFISGGAYTLNPDNMNITLVKRTAEPTPYPTSDAAPTVSMGDGTPSPPETTALQPSP